MQSCDFEKGNSQNINMKWWLLCDGVKVLPCGYPMYIMYNNIFIFYLLCELSIDMLGHLYLIIHLM